MGKVVDFCDICWDETKADVPATVMHAGVPLCDKHASSQRRFVETPEGVEELGDIAVKPALCYTQKCTFEIDPRDGKHCTQHSFKLLKEQEHKVPEVKPPLPDNPKGKAAAVASNGIRTSYDFAAFMGALMTDLVNGTVDPQVASAACTAGDKMLKVIEMQIRYGTNKNGGREALKLTE